MSEQEFKVEVDNIGSDGTTKRIHVSGHGITLTNYYLYYTPITNWRMRRWVKSAKKTIKRMVKND